MFNLSGAWNRFRSTVNMASNTYSEVGRDVERVWPKILSKTPRLEDFPSDYPGFDGVLEGIIRLWDDLHAIPPIHLLLSHTIGPHWTLQVSDYSYLGWMI
jgi:hypothetical protein